MKPIAYFRILNAMLTTLNASIASAQLPTPWSIIVPLIIGVVVQGIGEAIAQLTIVLKVTPQEAQQVNNGMGPAASLPQVPK